MARDQSDPTPIESRAELVAWFEQGNKTRVRVPPRHRHEKFGFYAHDHAPVPYAGARGVEAILKGLEIAHRLGADSRRRGHHRARGPMGGGAFRWSPVGNSSSRAPL